MRVNFARLIAQDTLIAGPARSMMSDPGVIGRIAEKVDVIRRLLRVGY